MSCRLGTCHRGVYNEWEAAGPYYLHLDLRFGHISIFDKQWKKTVMIPALWLGCCISLVLGFLRLVG